MHVEALYLFYSSEADKLFALGEVELDQLFEENVVYLFVEFCGAAFSIVMVVSLLTHIHTHRHRHMCTCTSTGPFIYMCVKFNASSMVHGLWCGGINCLKSHQFKIITILQ